jgi:ACT domain-containing protein
MKLNCAGRMVEELHLRFETKVPVYPESFYEKRNTLREMWDLLKEIGLEISTTPKGKNASFWFKDLFKNNIVMLISYCNYKGDKVQHVSRVEYMTKNNLLKLHDKEELVNQDDFEIIITTFVSNKSMDNIIEYID